MDEPDLIQLYDDTEEEQKEGSDNVPPVESSMPSLDSEASSNIGSCGSSSSEGVADRPTSNSNFESSYMAGLFHDVSSSPKVGKEFILGELLSDIRRSCATSLASTPTAVISEGETTKVFLDCKVRRSDIELRTLGK